MFHINNVYLRARGRACGINTTNAIGIVEGCAIMQYIKLIIVGAICFLIGYFIPSAPDVHVIHDKIFAKSSETGTTFITIKASSTITGATGATIKPTGETIVSGTNLSINTASETSSKTITVKETEFKEVFKEKIINHTAGVGLAFNPLNPINEFGAGGSIIIFQDIQINGIITQRNLFKEINSMVFVQYLF